MFDLDSAPAPEQKIASVLVAMSRNTTAAPSALRELADELFDTERSARIPEDMFALSWDERYALRGAVFGIATEVETGRETVEWEMREYNATEARDIFYIVRTAELAS
jgi:hypothetical protein